MDDKHDGGIHAPLRHQAGDLPEELEVAGGNGQKARQAVTQHLQQWEEANLVAVIWQGREKLHSLNPLAQQEIYQRWSGKFERRRIGRLAQGSVNP